MAEATCSYSGEKRDGYKPGELTRLVEEGRKEDVVKYLACAGNTVDGSDRYKLNRELEEGVMITIVTKKPDMLRCLVHAGAQLNASHENKSIGKKEPLLHTAFRTGDPDIVNIFMQYFKEHPKASDYTTHGIGLLIAAFDSRNIDFITQAWSMLQEKDSESTRSESWCPIHDLVLHEFAKTYTSDILTYLLEEVTDFLINKGYEVDGQHPFFGCTPLYFAIQRDRLPSVRALIKHGATVLNQRDYNENIWELAYIANTYNVLQELLQGISVAEHQEKFASLLHGACGSEESNIQVVRYLLDRGVDINFTDRELGQTPLDIAMANQAYDIVETIVQHALDYARCYNESEMMDALGFLLAHSFLEITYSSSFDLYFGNLTRIIKGYARAGINLNAQTHLGHTLLMDIDIHGLYHFLKLLVQCGADVNAVAEDGRTVLMNAVCCGDPDDPDEDKEFEQRRLSIIGNLLEQNIDIGVSRHLHDNMSTLQTVFCRQDHAVCNLLLDADCSLYKMTEFIGDILESELSEDMQRVRTRILEICDEPYSLKAQARLAVLRAIGQCDLRETLHRMHRCRVLPKALVDYLGKTINFDADAL